MSEQRDLRAREAAATLGVSLSTLYAYVSRGLIHSRSAGDGSRERRYSFVDVHALKERQMQRRDPSHAAVTALNWGTPVLESAITLIENGRLFYRGLDALRLAQTRHFEEVAGLLWTGRLETPVEVPVADPLAHVPQPGGLADFGPLERFQILLPYLEASDPAAYDLRPNAVVRAGGRVLSAMVAVIAEPVAEGPVADRLATRLAPQIDGAGRLIDAALILSADHELNVSSFTVRCVASARAPLYDAISAGIGALRGIRHGASSHRIEALLAEVGRPERAGEVLANRLRRGEPIPGFGHHLYPNGDPRAWLLLDLCRQTIPDDPAQELTNAVLEAARDVIGEPPNIDFGLVTVARALRLQRGSALTLMSLGRTAGWIAHALEQYQVDAMIRPRARYVGPSPMPDE